MVILESIKNIKGGVDYAYPNARVMAMRGFMLRDEDLKGLSSAKHLEEYAGLLEHTVYKKYISKVGSLDIDVVESALLNSLVELNRFLVDLSPRNSKDFFSVLVTHHEIELMKLILNRFESNTGRAADYSAYAPIMSPEFKKFVKSLEAAKTKEEALSMLKNTRYGFLSGLSGEDLKNPACLASMMDKYYLEALWDAAGRLSKKDAGYAKRIIGTEMDIANIMTLLLASVHGYKAERFVIPSSYRLGKLSAYKGKNTEELVSLLSKTYYGGAVAEGYKAYEKDRSLLKLEMNLRKYLTGECKAMFMDLTGHAGLLLGFLKLKEYEVKNLRAIAVAIDNNLSQKEIMELVVS